MTDENGNIIEEKNIIEDKLATQVKDWLLQCEKTLDFVYGQEQSIPPLNVFDALQGPAHLKICDPYGYIEEPPLCKKIKAVEDFSGKLLDKSENYSGKLTVKLTTGEELFGKWVDGGREGQGSIVGNYEDGILKGRGRVLMKDGGVKEGYFQC